MEKGHVLIIQNFDDKLMNLIKGILQMRKDEVYKDTWSMEDPRSLEIKLGLIDKDEVLK